MTGLRKQTWLMSRICRECGKLYPTSMEMACQTYDICRVCSKKIFLRSNISFYTFLFSFVLLGACGIVAGNPPLFELVKQIVVN